MSVIATAPRTTWQRLAGARSWRAALALVIVVLLVVAPLQSTPYRNLQLTLAAVWVAAAVGVNLLTGYNGQLSLATSAFFGLGAYAEALLLMKADVPYGLGLLVVAAGGFLFGFLVGIPATRLRGLYLALMTLALAVSLPPLLNHFDSLTGGSQGLILPQFTAPQWSGLAEDQWLYYLAVFVAALAVLVCRNLTTGGIGRAIVAQKDDSVVAEVLGVRLFTHRTLVFAISSMVTSVAGGVYALVIGLLNPDTFAVMVSVTVLAGVVVGGTGTVLGSVIAGFFIEYTPVVTGTVSKSLSGVIYGAVLIVVMILLPDGLVGGWHRLLAHVSKGNPQSRPVIAADQAGDSS